LLVLLVVFIIKFVIQQKHYYFREAEDRLNVKDDNNTVEPSSSRYNIEFTFDSDVKCAITIYYFATEEIVNKQAVYVSLIDLAESDKCTIWLI